MKLFNEIRREAKSTVESEGAWLIGETGIVAENEDPERQHRVKVLIPAIDENLVFDDWVRQMVFCMGNGYGSVFIPPIGSEVVLFGQLGQKFNLFYAGVYNEEMQIAEDFEDSTVSGMRVPGDFKIIADLDGQLRAGRWSLEADSQINIVAPGGVIINGKKL